MRFDHLPTELITSIIKNIEPEHIGNLARTNQRMYQIAKKSHFHNYDYAELEFNYPGRNSLYLGKKNCREATYPDSKWVKINCKSPLYEKIENILLTVGTVNKIIFRKVPIVEKFANMLKVLGINWKTSRAEFHSCDYLLQKAALISFWEMFKFTKEFDGNFLNSADVIDDELITRSPRCFQFKDFDKTTVFEYCPGLTDKTLEFFSDYKCQANLQLGRYIGNYTVEGVKEWYKKMLKHTGITLFEIWNIGAIELDRSGYNQLLKEFKQFETRNCQLIVNKDWSRKACLVTVYFTPWLGSTPRELEVLLIKPKDILAKKRITRQKEMNRKLNLESDNLRIFIDSVLSAAKDGKVE